MWNSELGLLNARSHEAPNSANQGSRGLVQNLGRHLRVLVAP